MRARSQEILLITCAITLLALLACLILTNEPTPGILAENTARSHDLADHGDSTNLRSAVSEGENSHTATVVHVPPPEEPLPAATPSDDSTGIPGVVVQEVTVRVVDQDSTLR